MGLLLSPFLTHPHPPTTRRVAADGGSLPLPPAGEGAERSEAGEGLAARVAADFFAAIKNYPVNPHLGAAKLFLQWQSPAFSCEEAEMRWGRRSLLATSSLVAMAASAPVLAQGVVTNPVPVNGVFTTTPGVTGVVLTGESFTGTILNAAPVTLGQYKVGIYTGIAVGTKSFNGAIINAGNIEVATNYPTNKHAFGIAVGAGAGGVFNGSVTNSGFITSRE